MEILFENHHTRDKKLANELYSYYFFKRPSYIVCDILLGVLFVVNIALIIMHKECSYWMLILPPILYFSQFFMYQQTSSSFIKQDKAQYGDDPVTIKSEIYDSELKNTASCGTVSTLQLTDIKKAVKTKNLILLYTKTNLIYPLSKNGFSKGSEKEFIDFLKSKNISVR